MNQKGERLSAAVLVLLKRSWTLAFVMLLLFGSALPLAAAANPKSSCPTTGKTVFVVMVDPNPKSAAVGTTVATTVAVSYSNVNVTPFALSPETISFRWVSTAGERIVKNAPVVPTGTTGIYTYTQTVGDDFPTGTVTIYVLACSCSDGQGNYGPPMDVNSDSTIYEKDSSMMEIGATMQQPATQELLAAYSVPIVIAIVVIVALLLLVLRRHKKKT